MRSTSRRCDSILSVLSFRSFSELLRVVLEAYKQRVSRLLFDLWLTIPCAGRSTEGEMTQTAGADVKKVVVTGPGYRPSVARLFPQSVRIGSYTGYGEDFDGWFRSA
jgi:hypothetical protein